MHDRRRIVFPVLILVILGAVGLWYWQSSRQPQTDGSLTASGTVEAVEVQIAAELGGRVAEVLVQQGQQVQAGEPLLRLDDELLRSQLERAQAALAAAQANRQVAETGLEQAEAALNLARVNQDVSRLQLEIALDLARRQEQPIRKTAWNVELPREIEQPAWYFTQDEEIAAARAEAEAAKKALEVEQTNFAAVIAKASSADLRLAEQRLAQAQAAFLVADELLERAKTQGDEELEDAAQSVYDAAKNELQAAQADYERLLSSTASQEVLEARARLAVAQERYDTALDRLSRLLTGEAALQVAQAEAALQQAQASTQQAEANVKQAQARLEQAEKAIAQAKAEVKLVEVQLKKLVIHAPVSGVVLSRDVEPGEVIQPAATVMTLGQLDQLTITVYVPEDEYGQLRLGQQALVQVDSFPGESFQATIIRIADQAEFTPRNVQTSEGRRTTVFAVELSLGAGEGKLKPGMPADVTFLR